MTFKKKLKSFFKLGKRTAAIDHNFNEMRASFATDSNKLAGIFDAEWYYKSYPDVKEEGQDPFYHYVNHGYLESRNPGPTFDTDFYRGHYPDVAAAGVNPLIHYLQTGRAEGRVPNPQSLPPRNDDNVRHVIVKEMAFDGSGEAAVLVTHAPAGRLKPHVLPMMTMLRGNGVAVLLTVVVDRPLELRPDEIAMAGGIIVRDNAGYDFGAWAHALRIEPSLFGADMLYLMNDSVVPSADAAAFGAMFERLRASRSDVIGLTASHEYGWHVSSYFLALKPKALSSWVFHHFVRDIKILNDKDQVIRAYEVPFTARMQAGGLTVEALYDGTYSANPALFSWRELAAQGFPFVKLLLLRDHFLTGTDWPLPIRNAIRDIQKNWPKVLETMGFDVDLVRSAIKAADFADVPRGAATDLLVDNRRSEIITEDHKLRVAFFGPWNYDNGLGAASRELLCALRHTDIRLNAYPVTEPFHVHRLVCPPVATIDCDARPDIAIVHLNPDSWHLLTVEQRRIIASAKQRIGYWVWETDILPPAWQHDIRSVDRIWAPSRYCADVFAAEVDLPVDVVPHPVRVPTEIRTDRATMLRRLGVDPDRRVILYIFDGASYLIRKDPDALIRAFAASDLAASGWTLLLKVKHLFDRPETGLALSALADATPGVVVVDISLHADDITSLLAAADVYASPHRSEGFGLTVAEAMAVGKPVIATDFGGTRDFLNSDRGFPVRADRSTLDEDHGHYLKGHSWAKIDETALAEALIAAARSVSVGDDSIGRAARSAIAHELSYDSVAKAIQDSFGKVIEDSAVRGGARRAPPRPRPVATPAAIADFPIDPRAGDRFDHVRFSNAVVPVALSHDLTWNGADLPEGKDTDWIVLAPGDARIRFDADRIIVAAASLRPDVELFYADDAAVDGEKLDRVRLKPDFNQTLLVAQDYIGAPIIVRRKTLRDVGGLTAGCGSAVLYDLLFRVFEAGRTIARIPTVLIVHTGHRPVPDTAARRVVLDARKSLQGVDLVQGVAPELLNQRRRFTDADYPAVTILIPTNRTLRPGSQKTYVEHLLRRIAETEWPHDRVTVIVGDNFTDKPAWTGEAWPFTLRRVETPDHQGDGFNYAVKANLLWRQTTDEYVVFMNDDAAPENPAWLAAMVGFLIDQSVGCVGAQLFYENGAIQHAGIFPSLRTVVHAWLDWPVDARTYMNWSQTQREWSMVTGAVFATRRSILDRVGGFDERFSLEFNDVDLCLRIRNLGYRVVYNPDARFTHAEKASRGESAPPGAEVALFLSRWTDWLANDPASHPAYATNRLDVVPTVDPGSWFVKR